MASIRLEAQASAAPWPVDDYFYTSRLPGEPAEGVDDVHTHPLEPFTLRASVTVGF